MLRIELFVITLTWAVSSLAGQAPMGLRCEWRVNPTDVPDPHPELYWETASQSAYQVRVARSQTDLVDDKDPVWDSGRVETKLPITEYAGPELPNGTTFWWHGRRFSNWLRPRGPALASVRWSWRTPAGRKCVST